MKSLIEEFLVRGTDQIPCPCCGGFLKVIGSRKRKYINSAGDTVVLIIRRLKCSNCSKIHHELPDILVPYKRYDSESIETVITGNALLAVAADDSTISRWKKWFDIRAYHFLGCLISIATRYQMENEEEVSDLPKPILQRIFQLVSNAPAWLARVVRSVVNSNNWLHTRSVFMSQDM